MTWRYWLWCLIGLAGLLTVQHLHVIHEALPVWLAFIIHFASICVTITAYQESGKELERY